jgi:hypothetical protein
LSDPEIALLDLKTLPLKGRDDLVFQLLRHNYRLRGVPGFYIGNRSEWRLAGAPGIAIPVRDYQQRISGIQIRRQGDRKPKYVWLSSKNKANGCGRLCGPC